jgi:hypothetical protein
MRNLPLIWNIRVHDEYLELGGTHEILFEQALIVGQLVRLGRMVRAINDLRAVLGEKAPPS